MLCRGQCHGSAAADLSFEDLALLVSTPCTFALEAIVVEQRTAPARGGIGCEEGSCGVVWRSVAWRGMVGGRWGMVVW